MYKCNKCNGTGKSELSSHGSSNIETECTKCLGAGELDWIEYIIGKRKPKYFYVDWNNLWKNSYFDDTLEKEIINKMAEQIALDIDKQIMEEFCIKEVKVGADERL